MKFRKFLVFLTVLIVCVSLGMTVYYFVKDNEVIALSRTTIHMNMGDKLSVETLVESSKLSKDTVFDYNAGGDDVTKYIEYDAVSGNYVAKSGGEAKVVITATNNSRKKVKKLEFQVIIGNGTVDYPYYISTQADLLTIGKTGREYSLSYRLVNDITLTGEFVPIGLEKTGAEEASTWIVRDFTGVFDGGDCTINNMNISKDYDVAGFIASLSGNGKIINLRLANANINGSYNSAGVAAGRVRGVQNTTTTQRPTIERVTVSSTGEKGTLIVNTNENGRTGLIAGTLSDYGRVFRTSGTGTVEAKGVVGGLVGASNNGWIEVCWSDAKIRSYNGAIVGGLVGHVSGVKPENTALTKWYAGIFESYSISSMNNITIAPEVSEPEVSEPEVSKEDNTNISIDIMVSGAIFGKYEGTTLVMGLYFNTDRTTSVAVAVGGDGDGLKGNYALNGVDSAQMRLQETFLRYKTTSTGANIGWKFSGGQYWAAVAGNYPIIVMSRTEINWNDGTSSTPGGNPETPETPQIPPDSTGNVIVITPSADAKANVAQLTAAFDNVNVKYIILKGDIDLGGEVWDPAQLASNSVVFYSETGSFTISNFRIFMSKTSRGKGFFSDIHNEAAIKNINFSDITMIGHAEEYTFGNVGTVAGVCKGVIQNVNVSNVTITKVNATNLGGVIGQMDYRTQAAPNAILSATNISINSGIDALGRSNEGKVSNLGGVVGELKRNGSTAYPTEFFKITNATINNAKTSTGTGSDPVYTGGITGQNHVMLAYAEAKNVSIRSSGYMGGLTGINAGEILKSKVVYGEKNSIFIAESQQTIASYAGGAAGQNIGTIRNVTVNTNIKNQTNPKGTSRFIGGIAGDNQGSIVDVVFEDGATVNINTNRVSRIGGIVGFNMMGKEIEFAYNYGTIKGNASSYLECVGGIAGWNDGSIRSSANMGNVIGAIAGGLAGYQDKEYAIVQESYVGSLAPFVQDAYKIDATKAKPTVQGYLAGGFIAIMYAGKVDKCYAEALMKPLETAAAKEGIRANIDQGENELVKNSIVAGMVSVMPSRNNGKAFGTVSYSVSACSFEKYANSFDVSAHGFYVSKAWFGSNERKNGTIYNCFVITDKKNVFISDDGIQDRSDNRTNSMYMYRTYSQIAKVGEMSKVMLDLKFDSESVWSQLAGHAPIIKTLLVDDITDKAIIDQLTNKEAFKYFKANQGSGE